MGVSKPQPFRCETICEICGQNLCAALLRARSDGVVLPSTLSPSGLHSNTNRGNVQLRLKQDSVLVQRELGNPVSTSREQLAFANSKLKKARDEAPNTPGTEQASMGLGGSCPDSPGRMPGATRAVRAAFDAAGRRRKSCREFVASRVVIRRDSVSQRPVIACHSYLSQLVTVTHGLAPCPRVYRLVGSVGLVPLSASDP
jgi:hypothetical protein